MRLVQKRIQEAFDLISVDRIYRRIEQLGKIGGNSDGGVTRLAYSDAENEAFAYVRKLLSDEYVVEEDSVGNLFATRDPDTDRSIYTGSHLDTVFNGGRLDGALGVICSLEAVDAVYESDATVAYPPTLAMLRAEESARFGHHTVGSRASLGTLGVDAFSAVDQNGMPLWRAIQSAGFRPKNLSEPSTCSDRIAAFLEVHIEQGRKLEETDTDVGVVSSIRGTVRHRFTVTGDYDHSGATPMSLRRDALAAASDMIVTIQDIVEDAAMAGDIVGTVGRIDSKDGAINKVCGEVKFPLDLRSSNVEYRDTVESTIVDEIKRIADVREVTVESELIDRTMPVVLDTEIVSSLQSAAGSVETQYRRMPSGGGHDAMNFQEVGIPTGILFVPSIDGVSHHPDEQTTRKGIHDATRTLASTLIEYE